MKRLYLPLEIVVRELDSKMLLACEAANNGWFVTVGSKRSVFRAIDKNGPGVVLVKSLTESESGQFARYRRRGCKVVSLDEEGVVTYPEFLTSSIRYSDKTACQADKIYFWGAEQQQYFNKALPQYKKKGQVTGSPRVDFWRNFAKPVYASKAQYLRSEYGEYIFFATSFGIANHYQGGDVGLTSTLALFRGLSPELKRFIDNQWLFNRAVFEEYLEAIDELAAELAKVGLNLVIRPHPSESQDQWVSLSQRHDNVFVEYEGSVTAWILGARALVHFKSTTALEAYFMGTPCITYVPPMPEAFDRFELKVPNSVSKVCSSREDFIQTCLLEPSTHCETEDKTVLQGWIHDSSDSSSKTLVHALPDYSGENRGRLNWLDIFESDRSIKTLIRNMLVKNKSYGRHKTEGLDPVLALKIVCEFNRVKTSKVRLNQFGDLFILSSSDDL